MRILMTVDSAGGVWQYGLALARGLVEQHGCSVMLVCMGDPRWEDLEAAGRFPMEVVPVPLRLEWMPDSARDVERALEEVGRLVRSWNPHVLHSNQFCFGLLRVSQPTVVVAHSDVMSWQLWSGTGEDGSGERQLQDTGAMVPWLPGYRQLVQAGLQGATAVVCPSRFMAMSLMKTWARPARVIYNGLWPDQYRTGPKAPGALLAGRLWDRAKGAALAVRAVEGLPLQLDLVGPTVGPDGEATLLPQAGNVRYLGPRSWQDTREAMARARIYVAASTYEPFGLAVLEAALSGCALLLSDIPSHRELWGDAALLFPRGDVRRLRQGLVRLIEAPGDTERLGQAARARAMERFTADRMAREYLDLYNELLAVPGHSRRE